MKLSNHQISIYRLITIGIFKLCDIIPIKLNQWHFNELSNNQIWNLQIFTILSIQNDEIFFKIIDIFSVLMEF